MMKTIMNKPDGRWRDKLCKVWSSSPRSHLPGDSEIPCGELPGSTSRHTLDTSTRRDAGPAAGAFHRTQHRVASAGVLAQL